MHRTTALAATVALLTAGCGSAPVAVPAGPASVAAASSSRATLTIEEAAKAYEAAVAPGNKLTFQFNTEVQRRPQRMDRIRELGKQMQAASRELLDVLHRTAWPPEVQPAIDDLAKDVAADITWSTQVATAKTPADLPRETGDGAAAQLVRARLGLGVVPASG